jgi:RNA polymerase sigma-70 factor (ECF subfamily)
MSNAPHLDRLDERPDGELVALTAGGMTEAFGAIITRYNQRLYRVARSILRDNAEAEDAVQEAYLRAFAALKDFRGDASLGTWLTRITVNESLSRLRRRRPSEPLDTIAPAGRAAEAEILVFPGATRPMNPEQAMAVGEIRHLLERAIDGLSPAFRIVFVLREIEGLSVEETATQLELPQATVKTRLHRARRLLRKSLDDTVAAALRDTFPFRGARCERTRAAVLARIAKQAAPKNTSS